MKWRIQHITRPELNEKAYNECIQHASNGVIYAYSWYLDAMADNWDILVANDYEAVMPIPWRKKYGIRYLYMPAFIPVLGVFGKEPRATDVQKFLESVPAKFSFWEISMNSGNSIPPTWNPFPRTNFVLPLQQDYETLFKNYRQNIQRNCRKSAQMGGVLHKDIPITEVTSIAREQLQAISNITNEDFSKFETLYQFLRSLENAITYAIKDASGKILASCVFFFSHHRAYYILVGNHPNGRTMGASHALIDGFIRDYAGKNLVLDFEGSDIRNLAFFYSSFGAEMEVYHGIKMNRLPWWAKLFKK